jgi:transcriptional regulator with XRE-family HTH domain
MPKPSSLLNKREREICGRVHLVRTEIVKWSQPNLAKELGITQNQLAGLEYARNPLRYGIARILCDKCHISQRWLATGDLPIRVFVDVHISYEKKIASNLLFSEAYDAFLAKLVESELVDLARINHCEVADLDKHRRSIGTRWPVGVQAPIRTMKESEWPKSASERFSKSKDMLDILRRVSDDEAVKAKPHSLPALISKLGELTSLRGQKAALARELKVSRQAVDQWLSGSSKPTAETTLKLLNWVEQQERQK